jgi:hypothetical protein
MNRTFKKIALPVSAIIIFTAGVMWGVHMASPDEIATIAGSSPNRKPTTKSIRINTANDKPNKKRPGLSEKATTQHQIIADLRAAMCMPQEARIKPLLKSLEETSKISLGKDLAEIMRSIVDEGELESTQYLMSLLEQREEKAAIDLLLHAAEHEDRDISDRALFALEAVAGTVFKTKNEAATWAASWQPDPDRVKLFSPDLQNDDETPAQDSTRMPGPGSQPRQTPAESAPESGN